MKYVGYSDLISKQRSRKRLRTLSALLLIIVTLVLPNLFDIKQLNSVNHVPNHDNKQDNNPEPIPITSQLGSLGWDYTFNNTKNLVNRISKDGTMVYSVIAQNDSYVFQYNVTAYYNNGSVKWSYKSQGNYSYTVSDILLSENENLVFVLGRYLNRTEITEESIFLAVLQSEDGILVEEYRYCMDNGQNEIPVSLIPGFNDNVLYILGQIQTMEIIDNIVYYYNKIHLLKIDLTNFSVLWDKNISDTHSISPLDGTITSDGKYIYIAGYKNLDLSNVGFFLKKFDREGQLVSHGIQSTGNQAIITNIAINDQENRIFALGRLDGAFSNITILEFDMDCNLLRQSSFGYPDRDLYPQKIINNPASESFYVSGTRILYGQDDKEGYTSFIGEIDKDLNLVWNNYSVDNGLNHFIVYSDIDVDPQNGFMIIANYSEALVIIENENVSISNYTISKMSILMPPIAPTLEANTPNPVRTPSLQLSWSNSTSAINYTLIGAKTPFTTKEQAEVVQDGITGLTHDLDLSSTEFRYFAVFAKNDYGESPLSNVIEVIYLSTDDAPFLHNPFENMNKQDYSFSDSIYTTLSESIVLSWDATSADNYLVMKNDTIIKDTTSLSYTALAEYGSVWNYSIIPQTGGVNGTASNCYLVEYKVKPQAVTLNLLSGEPIIQNISMNWNASPEASSYQVYASGVNFTEQDPLKYLIPVATTASTEIELTLDFEGMHYFTVVAVSEDGTSEISNIISAMVYMPIQTPEIYCSVNKTTNREVFISVTNTRADAYYVFRSNAPFDSVDGMQPLEVNLNSTVLSFIDNFTEVGQYYYRAIANKIGINSSLSNQIMVIVEDLPSATSLSIGAPYIQEGSGMEINGTYYEGIYSPFLNFTGSNERNTSLSWDAVDHADRYLLYRYNYQITEGNINDAELIANTTELSYVDTNYLRNDILWYCVRVYNSSGYSGISNVINVLQGFAPDTMNINAVKTRNRTITITWDEQDFKPNSYILLYNETEITEANRANLFKGNDYRYFIGNFNNITFEAPVGTYYYALIGENEYGFGNLSNVIIITQEAVPFEPIMNELPESQYIEYVQLNWTAQQDAEYYVYRSIAPIEDLNSLVPIATSTTNSYLDTIENSGKYYYAVKAFNATGNSSLSNVVSIEVMKRPVVPILNDVQNGVNKLNISWTDPYDYNNYSVKIGLTPDFNIEENSLWIHNITDKSLSISTNFTALLYIWVISYNNSIPSLNGTYMTATHYYITAPNIWTLHYSIFVDKNITIYIDPMEHVEKFEIYRSTTANINISESTPWKIIDYTTEFSEDIIELGSYYYVFVPTNQFGKGNQSDVLELERHDRPHVPKIVSAVVDEFNSVTVTWESVAPEFINGYKVFYSRNPITNETNPNDLINSGNLDRDRTSFKFIHIGYGKFYFVVCTFNASSLSYYSEVIILEIENVLPEREPMPMWLVYLIGGIVIGFVTVHGLVMRSRRKTGRMLEDL